MACADEAGRDEVNEVMRKKNFKKSAIAQKNKKEETRSMKEGKKVPICDSTINVRERRIEEKGHISAPQSASERLQECLMPGHFSRRWKGVKKKYATTGQTPKKKTSGTTRCNCYEGRSMHGQDKRRSNCGGQKKIKSICRKTNKKTGSTFHFATG